MTLRSGINHFYYIIFPWPKRKILLSKTKIIYGRWYWKVEAKEEKKINIQGLLLLYRIW